MRRPRLHHNLKRLGSISFQNIKRNLFLSIATTVMLGLILFIFNVIMVLNSLTQSSLNQLGEKVDLILYLSESSSVHGVSELISDIERIPEVIHVQYTSKEEALERFLADYPKGEDPFSAYELSNPLPANIQIKTSDPSHHNSVIENIQSSKYGSLFTAIESSNENQEIVNKLINVTQFTRKLTLGVIATFIFGALLMIINAIHLSIFTRKREIQIMQLVGAKPSMIRMPFFFEGAIYCSIAVLFSLILLLVFLQGTHIFELINLKTQLLPAIGLISIELVASISIGIASSWIAINRYLKRNFILT